MLASILSFVLLALLAVIAIAAFHIGPRLPDPYHVVDGSGLILFALVVYITSCIRFAFAAMQISAIKAALRSRHRQILVVSVTLLIAYIAWGSVMLVGLLRSTDL